MGAGALGKAKLGVVGLAICLGLMGCERELVLEGERFDVRTPLDASVPVEGEPAPTAAALVVPNAAAPIALPGAVANAEWTHRGGSARHSGPHGQLSAAPQLVWAVSIGSGNSRRNRVAAAPVVVAGRVVAMDARSVVTAVSTGGALQWQTSLAPDYDKTATEVSGGGLAAHGNRIYATTGFGELVALDAGSGAVIWRQRLEAPAIGAPATDGRAVYAVARDGAGVAVAADTGKILWQVPGTRSASGMVGTGSPAVGDGAIIFPFSSGEVAAVDPAEGTRTWGAAVAGQRLGRAYASGLGDITGDPVVAGGVIYVGTAAGRTAAIDAKTGQRLWSAPEGAINPPLVVGGSVFVVNDESKLVRMDAATGEVIWRAEMPYFTADKPKRLKAITVHYGPVLAGGRVAVVSTDGQIRLFSATDGALVGGGELPGGAASPPALAAGLMFVIGAKGQLLAFR